MLQVSPVVGGVVDTCIVKADATLEWSPRHITDLHQTVGVFRRGPRDPTYHAARDGSVWLTARMPTGPATMRLTALTTQTFGCQAWGPGAVEAAASAPELIGSRDTAADFEPIIPVLVEAHRRNPGIRIARSGRVFEALVPAILEQKVISAQAHDSWWRLLWRFGVAAPGPVPRGMRVSPTPEQWRHIPSWEWHRAGVGPDRSRTIVGAAKFAARIEEAAELSAAAAQERLQKLPGIGVWTAAEVAQRALGDPDALSVGDYHLANYIGHAFAGRDMTDEEMLATLAPWAGHRHRVVLLLQAAKVPGKPRRGPRMEFVDHTVR